MDTNKAPQFGGVNLMLSIITGVVTAVVFGVGCFFLVYNSDSFMGWTHCCWCRSRGLCHCSGSTQCERHRYPHHGAAVLHGHPAG
jgi:hypothetical protein